MFYRLCRGQPLAGRFIRQFCLFKVSLMASLASLLCPAYGFCSDWTPMIAPEDFDGIRTDVMTMVGGVISILLIVVGLAYLVRTISK